MISTLEINLALRRAFKNRYQNREIKAQTSPKGKPVKSQFSIATRKTTAEKKNRPNQGKREFNAGRAPSSETGYRQSWNQEVLAMLRYSTSTVRMGF